ncbi:hypothetical protein [Novosphingobium lindaniclasticum]
MPERAATPHSGRTGGGMIRSCIAALVDVLVEEVRPGLSPSDRATVRDYVLATSAAMPDHFRLGFRGLALLFELSSLPVHGHRFSRLAPGERTAHVRAWRGSRIGFRRSMIAFYSTFSCYGLYSLPLREEQARAKRIAA